MEWLSKNVWQKLLIRLKQIEINKKKIERFLSELKPIQFQPTFTGIGVNSGNTLLPSSFNVSTLPNLILYDFIIVYSPKFPIQPLLEYWSYAV